MQGIIMCILYSPIYSINSNIYPSIFIKTFYCIKLQFLNIGDWWYKWNVDSSFDSMKQINL